jgi:hypothetical protein
LDINLISVRWQSRPARISISASKQTGTDYALGQHRLGAGTTPYNKMDSRIAAISNPAKTGPTVDRNPNQ